MGTPLINKVSDDFRMARDFIRHQFSAYSTQGHGIHSPFVFDFVTAVCRDKKQYEDYRRIEQLRSNLSRNHSVLEVADLGAGSTYGQSSQRSVSSIVRRAAKPKKFGQLLYRIAAYYQPQTILELGTSLGLSTAYLALGNPKAKVYTIEGSTQIASVAKNNFRELGLSNIELREGAFSEQLPGLLREAGLVDLAFIDGDHRYSSTLDYFEQLLVRKAAHTVMIFDDIHWSEGMQLAWNRICQDPRVMLSVDLFFLGMVFFNPSFRVKQHFRIRF
jgi:predicted O-methyltransferase YrrM